MKTRLILLGVLILIIGFVLGMLTSAQLRLQKLKPVRMYFSEERFKEGFYKIIQPDDEQKAKIDLIIEKYAKLNSDLQGTFRKELDSNLKAMRKELDSNLTKEQLARLKDADERRQEMMKQERGRRLNDSARFHNDRERYPGGGPPDRMRNPDAPPPSYNRPDSAASTNTK
jgi:hypothetical protein